MTHLYVVERASEYLSKRCNVVLPEFFCFNREVPDGWGLLYVYPSGSVRKIKESFYKVTNDSKFRFHKKNKEAEMHVLYYYARRANYAGVHNRIIEYRGYDS